MQTFTTLRTRLLAALWPFLALPCLWGQTPAISLTATANPPTYRWAGEEITYTFIATNTGDVPLTDVLVTASLPGLSVVVVAPLAPGESALFTGSYAITSFDVDDCAIWCFASVRGHTPEGDTVEAEDLAVTYAEVAPLLLIDEASASSATYGEVGEVITYTVWVVNAGNGSLRDLSVHSSLNNETYPLAPSLFSGESGMATIPYTLTEADLDSCTLHHTLTAVGMANSQMSAQATVVVPVTKRTPEVMATVSPASCANTQDGQLLLDIQGGVPPYVVAWGTGDTGNLLQGVGPGTFAVTLTDASDCMVERAFTVGTALGAEVTGAPTVFLDCQTGQATLTGTSALEASEVAFAWYGPDGSLLAETAEIITHTPGMHRFRVTPIGEEDCHAEVVVQVEAVQEVTITLSTASTTVCRGAEVAIAADVSGGHEDCVIQWQRRTVGGMGQWQNLNGHGPSLAIPDVEAYGDREYRVLYTCPGGCGPFVSDTLTIYRVWPPWSTVQPQHQSFCTGGAGSLLTASVAGGANPCTVQWEWANAPKGPWTAIPGATENTLMPLDTVGLFYYRARYLCEGVPCEGISSFAQVAVLDKPRVDISLLTWEVCLGGTTRLHALRFGFGACVLQWQRADAPDGPWADIAGANSLHYTFSSDVAGTQYYRATYTCVGGDCDGVGISEVSAVTYIAPSASVSILDGDQVVCRNSPLTLTAETASSFGCTTLNWSRRLAGTTNWANVHWSTSYTITIPTGTVGTWDYRVRYQCCGTAWDSVTVTVSQPYNISIGPVEQTICVGGVATLTTNVSPIAPAHCTIQWQVGLTAEGPWADVPEGIGPTFSIPTSSAGTFHYRAVHGCADSGCAPTTSNAATVVVAGSWPPSVLLEQLIPPGCTGTWGRVRATVAHAGESFILTTLEGALVAEGLSGTPLVFGPLTPGEHCFLLTGDNGCEATQACITISAPLTVTPTVTPASCASTSDGSITLSVSGGTPPYVYTWGFGSNLPGQTGLPVGTYTLSVTDVNNCQYLTTIGLGAQLEVGTTPSGTTYLNCHTGTVLLTGTATLSGPDITYTWYDPTGEMLGNTPDLEVNAPGTYRFRATNAAVEGCFSEAEVTVMDFEALLAQGILVTQLGCNSFLFEGEFPPADYTGPLSYLWTWPDGSTSTLAGIVPDQTGTYQLRIGLENCELHYARYFDADAETCATLSGTVAHDLNANCVYDPGEPGLHYFGVRADNGTQVFWGLTDEQGQYSMSLPLGQYEVSVWVSADVWEACGPFTVNLDEEGSHLTRDLPVKERVLCGQLSVQLSTPLLRRCFSNYYYIKVCNIGTEVATAPEVLLELDSLLTYELAQFNPTLVEGQHIHWTLPELAPGQCRTFWVQVLVSCESVLGQVHCSTATATNSPFCLTGGDTWSGASLEVEGECADGVVRFRVINSGAGDLPQPIHYIVIEDAVMLMEGTGSLPVLGVSESETFDFPANGSTYTFRLTQAPGHPLGMDAPTVVVEGCGTDETGSFSTGFATQFPVPTATPASDILCQPNQGAYDPNDKQALPTGYGQPNYLRAGEEIRYLIRFQNTGTDTAFTVVIRDTLSPWLDVATLRPGNASHPYRTDMEGERTLVFTFDNILLPDSTTHLEGSQGFVDFDIRTLPDTPLETPLLNSAAIYFDFNEPIFTNTVRHTVGENFIVVEVLDGAGSPSALWRVYPNPAATTVTLELLPPTPGTKTLHLYDAQGRLAYATNFGGQQASLDVRRLPPGLYALQLRLANGSLLGVQRLVVR